MLSRQEFDAEVKKIKKLQLTMAIWELQNVIERKMIVSHGETIATNDMPLDLINIA